MQRLMNAEIMQHELKLRQMGADIQVINSKMCFVEFKVGKYDIAYCYNVNAKGRYFLERIKPYPLALREFDTEEDVITIIEIDLEQFKNASQSHNIDRFVDINKKLNLILRKFEDLFLYYNVPRETLEAIYGNLEAVGEIIDGGKRDENRLYYKKEPESL